eukprot:COSAG04_NODE_609_length_12066_cov_55.131695_3_plen_165_part_00
MSSMQSRPALLAQLLHDGLAVDLLEPAEGVDAVLGEDEVELLAHVVAAELALLLGEVARANRPHGVALPQPRELRHHLGFGVLRRHGQRPVDVEEHEGGRVLALGEGRRGGRVRGGLGHASCGGYDRVPVPSSSLADCVLLPSLKLQTFGRRLHPVVPTRRLRT